MSPPKPKPRVFLLANARKSAAMKAFESLKLRLVARGLLAGSDLNGDPSAVNAASPDFVIALGGDGTILHAGQAMQHRQVPIIGVNMGKLGYLADFSMAEVEAHLDDLLADERLISPRMMFDVSITPPGDAKWDGVALNDCVVRVGSPFRTISMDILVDEKPLCTVAADGMILATPTGSTAHNLACGGPIVEPGVETIIMTPMGPHSFTHRPVLISPSSTLMVRLGPNSRGAAAVLDGQCVRELEPGAGIVVARSRSRFQLVRNPSRTPWQTLIMKLKWGQNVT